MSQAEALDRLALNHLVTIYAHAVDRADYGLIRSLYHDDAVDDHGAMFCGSPDEYVAWLPGMLANWQRMSHQLTSKLFLIAGNSAEGVISCIAWHRTADGAHDVVAHGRYCDRYEKRDGTWKFLARSLVLDWSEERPAPAMDTTGAALGRLGGDDPLYTRLPLFGAERARRGG
ncbi:MAG: nuclear transport factor 2 family protein [Proteobacteria bacterium]|nr:nuclear transport factor 2 family protein [Pseudomonadota bacterium]